MKKKKKVADELRDLAGGYARTHAADLAKKWAARCLEEARAAAKNKSSDVEVTLHEIEAGAFGRSYDQYVSHYEQAVAITVRRLRREDLRVSHAFKHVDAHMLTGGMFGEETRDYPETYKLVIAIRW